VFLAFAVLTVAMTWPWARELNRAVPDPGDPFLNSWILWWDWFQTFNDPRHLFDGNIFFPHRLSLAFSEHNYGIALPLFPLFFLGASPILVHGVATLLGIALSGYAAWRLARTLTGSESGAWVAGIGFAFLPYRFHLLAHVNYVSTGWMLLALEALVLFSRKPSRSRAAWLGTAFLIHGLTCLHWLVLSALPFLLTGLLLAWLNGMHSNRDFWSRGGLAIGAAGLALLPFLWPYQEAARLYGFTRTLPETEKFSATVSDWWRVDPRTRTWAHLSDERVPAERALFPGLALPILAGLSVFAFRKGRKPEVFEGSGLGGIWVVLGSLGTNAFLHPLLFAVLPPYRSIRAPARWGMLAAAGLCILAAMGSAWLVSRFQQRGRAGLTGVICLLMLIEFRAAPLELHIEPATVSPVYEAIAKARLRVGIAEFPVSGVFDTSRYTLRAANHGKPLITATSGFIPDTMQRIERLTAERPIPDSLLDLLEKVPASVLVVHESRMPLEERAAYRDFLARGVVAGRLRYVDRFGALERDDVFTVAKVEPEIGGRPDLPWPVPSAAEVTKVFREDGDLPASLDEPERGARISGPLKIRGWARAAGEDLEVEIRIGDHTRPLTQLKRTPRDDVSSAMPHLGNAATAGFEAVIERLPQDGGPQKVRLVVYSRDGRYRVYPPVGIVWNP
jgi:hypothetical protein